VLTTGAGVFDLDVALVPTMYRHVYHRAEHVDFAVAVVRHRVLDDDPESVRIPSRERRRRHLLFCHEQQIA
jgi:hypothetical protein